MGIFPPIPPITEAEWCAGPLGLTMTGAIRTRINPSVRKWGLLKAEICRLFGDDLSTELIRLLDGFEELAEKCFPPSMLEPLERRAEEIGTRICIPEYDESQPQHRAWASVSEALRPGGDFIEFFCVMEAGTPEQQADVVREILGNPFRPVAFDPVWRTSTVFALAKGIYDEKAFDRMPILADALQDADCDNDDILNHLRDATAPHVRGCWALDLVLGKE